MSQAKVETHETKSQMNVGEIVSRIERMQPKEKQAFCKTLTSEEKKSYLSYVRDRDSEEVEVIFKCFEPMGGMVKFTAMPYKDVGGTYEFYDNMSYKMPICIARRFNNEFQGIGTFYPTHAFITDVQGRPMIGVGKKNYRFGTTSPSLM